MSRTSITGNGPVPLRAASLLLLLSLTLCSHAQSVALTFDDGLNPHTQAEAVTWNANILRALATANLTAMLLPACQNVNTEAGMQLVTAWTGAGHSLANHTYSHRNLSSPKVSAAAFVADVEKCDKVLSGVRGWTARLRFPYLKEGDTAQKRDAVRRWMAKSGYRPAPVSIDASDWYYNDRFLDWRKAHPGGNVDVYRQAYLAHLWNRASYYDELSKRVLGRSVKHVLLLHTNAINAAFLSDVIAMFRAKGWTIVSPEEAFADPVYALQPETLPAGEGIIWALAKQRGVEALRYPAEDGEYEKPLLDAL
jgi:peptidoglycan/xylan/chitin deacetylase (PgdA/CDA1 family)